MRRARHPLPPVSPRARSAAGGFPSGFGRKHQCNIRFALTATEVLRCRELTRWANNRSHALIDKVVRQAEH